MTRHCPGCYEGIESYSLTASHPPTNGISVHPCPGLPDDEALRAERNALRARNVTLERENQAYHRIAWSAMTDAMHILHRAQPDATKLHEIDEVLGDALEELGSIPERDTLADLEQP